MLYRTSNIKFTNRIPTGNLIARVFASLAFCIIPTFSHAGGWTQDAGKGLFVQNISYYSTSKYFDNSGNKQSINRYRKYELNPYIEYGLSSDWTIGANIFLQRTSQRNSITAKNQTNWGIGDSEFFARRKIWQKDGFAFSVEPMVKLPSLEKRTQQPQIGSRYFDSGLTFSGGYSFKAWQLDHFINFDAGYRHRFGTPHDQLKFAATAGLSVTKQASIITQVFTTSRLDEASQPTFTQASSDDYDLTKLQISAMYKMDDRLSFQAGAFTHVDGLNVGSGSGAVLSANKAF